MKINDKLYTKDGRKIGNCYVTFIDGEKISIVDCEGVTSVYTIDGIKSLFYIDGKEIKDLAYQDIIKLTEEGGMDFSLLRKLLYQEIEKREALV